MAGCPHDAREIKRALARQVKALGGEKVAAGITGHSTSQVQRWTSREHPDFPNVAAALELDANAPEPLVAQVLCRLLGGVFVALPEGEREPGAMADHVMEIVAQVGDLTSAVRMALADGHVDLADVRRLRGELFELITSAVAFDQMLAAIEGGE